MELTLSVIKADIGSIGGHICPSERLLHTVIHHIEHHGRGLLLDSYVSYTGKPWMIDLLYDPEHG
ncbi:MAG: fructose 1,6-bisphosphatase [Gammaproteobacteria bacterium]|nr:fructose 1,6-bisphosphatase [Gammaproteobacteria bacterium]